MKKFNDLRTKVIAYNLIFSLVIGISPLYAMGENCTLETFEYNDTVHYARYSCPRYNNDGSSVADTIGYSMVGAFIGLVLERASELAWYGVKKCTLCGWNKYKEHQEKKNGALPFVQKELTIIGEKEDIKLSEEDLRREEEEKIAETKRARKEEKKRKKEKEKKHKDLEDKFSSLEEKLNSLAKLIFKERVKEKEDENEFAKGEKEKAEKERLELMKIIDDIQAGQLRLGEELRKRDEKKELRKIAREKEKEEEKEFVKSKKEQTEQKRFELMGMIRNIQEEQRRLGEESRKRDEGSKKEEDSGKNISEKKETSQNENPSDKEKTEVN
jgi:hypothetical protein